MVAQRSRLLALAAMFRHTLRRAGLAPEGNSQIIPVLVGESARCVDLAAQARRAGLWVHPVRPPTVPQGTARFRLSLRADMLQAEWRTRQMS